MNCEAVKPLLEAHADGELDLIRATEIEAHLRRCPECAAAFKALCERREKLRAALPRFAASPELRRAIVSKVRVRPRRTAGWGALAAGFLVALGLGYAWGRGARRADALFQEAMADHVRSLQAGHLMDVASTDQHTVKPWFSGRVDFSPPVADLKDAGFPLAGGRLDRIDGQTAAALVFRRRLHAVNVFVWPATKGAVADRSGAADGYNETSWSRGGLNFLAISEIPATELAEFVREYRARL